MRRRSMGLRAAAAVVLAAAATASPALAAEPAVLCLVNPQSVGDDPNGFDWPATRARLVRDATIVCKALRGVVDAPAAPFDEKELLAKLAKLPADRPRIVFYAGHGQRELSTNRVSLPLKGGDVPLATVLKALDPGTKDTWSALIMNSCQSAYADLRGVEGHVAVIGSGWDKVSAQPNRGDDPESLTRFGAALTAGLSGQADAAHDGGNCDGVISDGEISRFIDDQMASAARKDVTLWKMAPVAAIRRNRGVDVPLMRLAAPVPGCREVARANGLAPPTPPAAFAARLASGDRLRAGAAPAALPPLVAVSAPAEADDIVGGLARVGQIAGFEIVRVDPGTSDGVDGWARRAAAVPVYRLEIRAAGADDWYLELVRGRDRATTWATFLRRGQPAADIVALIAPRLPRSLRVFHHFARSDGQLRATDGWSDGAIEAADWGSLARGAPVWSSRVLQGLRSDACPDFAGLCFVVPSETATSLEPLFLRRAR